MKSNSILLSLCFLLVAMTVVSGCQSNSGASQKEASGNSKTPQASTESPGFNVADYGKIPSSIEPPSPTDFPISKKKVTLTVMVVADPNIKDIATNWFTEWYEKMTNVHIDWQVIPKESAQKKLNIVLASGKYPDVLMNFGISNSQQMIYGKAGVFLNLNPYIEKEGTWVKKMFQEVPLVKKAITAPDGSIYGLPNVAECYHCTYSNKMWIYKPWLDKLGLKPPTTTDEFESMLKKFKANDPNGNGKADEIPLTGYVDPKGNPTLQGYLMNAFIYDNLANENRHMFLNNGKIDVAFNKPQWKEGLAYLHKLYTEGLIYPQTFTQNLSQLKAETENPGGEIVGAVPAQAPTAFTNGYGGKVWDQYVSIPPLKGPDGLKLAEYNPYDPARVGQFVITSSCKNPDIAFKWADLMYNKLVTINKGYGQFGKDWRWAKPGEKGIDGNQAVYYASFALGKLQNTTWFNVGPQFRDKVNVRRGRATDPKEPQLEVMLFQATKNNYFPYGVKENQVVPPLFFTDKQAAQLADLSKSINDYVNEMFARFITGDADLTTGWDTYLQQLQNLHLDQYIQINQSAYDAGKANQ